MVWILLRLDSRICDRGSLLFHRFGCLFIYLIIYLFFHLFIHLINSSVLSSYNFYLVQVFVFRSAYNLLYFSLFWYKNKYNPPTNFPVRSLDKAHHVVQNWTTGISQLTPSDLISVVRFFRAVQIKRKKSYLFRSNVLVKSQRLLPFAFNREA